jgi:hypothetical protein
LTCAASAGKLGATPLSRTSAEHALAATAPSSLPGSLPIPRTRLIGREVEREAARGLLLDDALPLLTMTRPGGVGKTRLALAIASDATDHFADGVVWVDLAPLADPALVPAAVVAALGLRPAADTAIGDVLIHALHPRQTLLLFDNCEHLVAAGDVDGAAIDSQVLAVALRDNPALAAALRVVEIFGPSTIQPLVVACHLPAAMEAAIQDAVTGIGDDPLARAALDQADVTRFTPVGDADYDDIRRMLATVEAAGLLAPA